MNWYMLGGQRVEQSPSANGVPLSWKARLSAADLRVENDRCGLWTSLMRQTVGAGVDALWLTLVFWLTLDLPSAPIAFGLSLCHMSLTACPCLLVLCCVGVSVHLHPVRPTPLQVMATSPSPPPHRRHAPIPYTTRQFRRAVFGFERWAAHRSTLRYYRHIQGIFSSRTVRALMPPLAYFAGISTLAGVYSLWLVPKYSLPKVGVH